MYESKIILLIFIFLTVWWSLVNIGKLTLRDEVPWGNLLLNAIGVTGVIAYFL